MELIGIAVGLFEITLVVAAYMTHPDLASVKSQFFDIPILNHDYFNLIAANVGAVIMPWMVFYQQGAIVDKGACCSCNEDLQCSRWDTAIGSVLAQTIMAGALVLTTATIGRVNPSAPLNSVQQIADAITPLIGDMGGKILFAVGITSAALIASIVVSLAAAWGVGELLGVKRSLNMGVKEAPWFYTAYGVGIVAAGLFVLSGFPLINLTIGIEILNTLMLPIVLGFLMLLAFRLLPAHLRLKKWEKIVLALIYVVIAVLSIFVLANL